MNLTKNKLNGNLGKKSLRNYIKRMEEEEYGSFLVMRNVTLQNVCLD
jgi:hypothetical protein